MQSIIRRIGSDLYAEATITDNNGDGITSVISVELSIENTESSLFWDTIGPGFDPLNITEDSLHTVNHFRDGLYRFILVGGAELIERGYDLHWVVTGGVGVNANANRNALYSDDIQAVVGGGGEVTLEDNAANSVVINKMWDALRSAHIVNGSFGENVNADLVKWAGANNIDGVGLTTFAVKWLAYFNGRFKVDDPNPGDLTFFQQNNITASIIMNLTEIERTRIL